MVAKNEQRFVISHRYGDTFIVEGEVDLSEAVSEMLDDGAEEEDFEVFELGARVNFYVERKIVLSN